MAWRICSRARSALSAFAAEFPTGVRRGTANSSVLEVSLHRFTSCSIAGLSRSRSVDENDAEGERFRDDQTALPHHINSWDFFTAKLEDRGKICDVENEAERSCEEDLFHEMKSRFLSFKENKFMKEAEHYQNLARIQSPKFVVIACIDSRVCPSNVLGFQPGEALTIRNVANIVPPSEFGPSETSAALEFAVQSLHVKNILVIGHSCCAGIEALMSMNDPESRSYVDQWLVNGKTAKLRIKSSAAHLDFNQQCKHCEKESVNESLKNLLTYPWIEQRVVEGELVIHGGYYDLVDCTFEKWTLYIEGQIPGKGHKFSFQDRIFWC